MNRRTAPHSLDRKHTDSETTRSDRQHLVPVLQDVLQSLTRGRHRCQHNLFPLSLSFTVAHLTKRVSYADLMAYRSKLAYVSFFNFKEPIALPRTPFCGKCG